jgi:predicted ester cyclase
MGALEDRNKSVVRRFGEALNSHNPSLLDELVAPDLARHCQASPWVNVCSLDEFKQFLEDDWKGVPDVQMTLKLMVAEADLVALYCTYSGTQTGQWGPCPPSGKRVEFEYSAMFRLSAGKIAEMWIVWDNLAILTQLGMMPAMAG